MTLDPWSHDDLVISRAFAEVALLDLALDVTLAALRYEHNIDAHQRPDDDDDLAAARGLFIAIHDLRRRLDHYRLAVHRARLLHLHDDIPF